MKKTTLTCLLSLAILLVTTSLSAQLTFVPKAVQSNNTVIQGLCDNVESNGWLYFKSNVEIDPFTFFDDYASDMGLGANDEMVVENDWDADGLRHIKFKQYHKGIPVKGAVYTMHIKGCEVKLAHGKIVEELNITLPATINESTALQNALNSIGATTYAWEDTDWEYQIQEDTGDPYATWYPNGELEIYGNPDVDMTASNFDLAYKFEILAIDPYEFKVIYVDAHTGSILADQNAADFADGTCSTLFNGTQTIQTKHRTNDYILRDETRGNHIWTKKVNWQILAWHTVANVTDDNNSWGSPNADATSAHWAAEKSWDYFLNTFGREGADGNGKQLRLYVGNGAGDAAYGKVGVDYIEVGITSGISLATLDMVGHEFTHRVSKYTANLSQIGEPAALKESFSDIFGEAIERDATGTNDWMIRADMGFPIRDMATPTTFGHPNTYMGSGWSTTEDPYTNCAVQNKWFNLLAIGGTLNGVTVSGIGFDKAAKITYSSMVSYIQENSDYADARSSAIFAAQSLFGGCSNEVIQTTNAWAAVGVGVIFNGPCMTITGPGAVCTGISSSNSVSWQASYTGMTVSWSYPSYWNCTISGVGNSVLTLTGMSPQPPFSTYATITATSSDGGTKTFYVYMVTGCLTSPNCFIEERQSIESTKPSISNDSENFQLRAYPNPTSENLFIESNAIEGVLSIELFDMVGQRLAVYEVNSTLFEINTTTLPKGIYTIKVKHHLHQKTITFVKF